MKKRKFKNIFKNIKKIPKLPRITFFIIANIYLISLGLIIYSLLLLTGIETLIRVLIIITLIIYYIIYFIISLYKLLVKKKTLFIFLNIFALIFSCANIFGFYYINKTYLIVNNINKEKIIYNSVLITLNDTDKISTVGMISNKFDIEGYILPNEYLENNINKYEIKYFDNYNELIDNLLNEKIDGIFITSNYTIKYQENYPNLKEKTKIIDNISKKMNNQDTVLSTNKSVTEPFTVLLLGVDSEYEGLKNNSAFNGDSIMMITFNPKTLSATMFSVPRDTYVPIACNNNKEYKINSAAGYGTKCMINTLENLVDIKIDYYVKINFKGVVALVEALNGITLDIDKPDYKKNAYANCGEFVCEQNSNREFGDKVVYIKPGKNQTLNGEQALAYSRNRHQWAMSDFKRIEHQQAVVSAIANKAKNIRDITTFYKLLDAVSNNIDTNMSTKEILNLYNVGKTILLNNNIKDNNLINIQKTFLTGYDLTLYLNGNNVYTFQYYEESLNEITTAMKENLELSTPTPIKTFTFSANKPYEQTVIGKKYSSVKKNETLPDFVGSSISYAKSWVSTRNISIGINENISNECTNDTIIEQDIHKGTLTSKITNINFKVCKNDINIPSAIENESESLIDNPILDMIE